MEDPAFSDQKHLIAPESLQTVEWGIAGLILTSTLQIGCPHFRHSNIERKYIVFFSLIHFDLAGFSQYCAPVAAYSVIQVERASVFLLNYVSGHARVVLPF